MKFTLLIVFTALLGYTSLGQQQPQYTHYILNHFAINPAIAGGKPCLDATLGYRNQWVGFEGAPKTAFGSFHTTISQNRFNPNNKHGLGALVASDRFGPFRRVKFKLAYAYHFQLTRKVLMSVGIFAGLEQISFRSGDVTLINYNDNAIGRAASAFIIPEISPGLFLQNDKWFAGLAVQQVIENEIKAVGTSESKLVRHGHFLFGLNFGENEWSMTPSILVKKAPAVPFSAELNVMFNYKNALSFGATYRTTDALAALVKFRVLDNFTVGYAFDYTLSQIQVGAANTHEIVLGINPCGNRAKGQYACPTFN